MAPLRIRHEGGGDARRGRSSAPTRLLRAAVVALGPPLVAFAADKTILASVESPMLLMIAAVVVSAAYGGLATGLVASITSAGLGWWYLVPPGPRHSMAIVGFLFVGSVISVLYGRLRHTNHRLAHTARQNQIFTELIENSIDFVGVSDPRGQPLYINPAGRRMVELPESIDIEQTSIPDYYPPEQQVFAEQTIVAEMHAHGKWAGETSFRNWRTGASIPVFDTHFLIRDPTTQRVIGIGTITRDISTQKAHLDALESANERLRATTGELAESQRYLQAILNHSPNAIIIKTIDGRYTVVNNAFRAIARLGEGDVQGRFDTELLPAALAQHIRANDERAMATHRAVVTEEALELDGQRRVFVMTKFPLFDEKNTIFALGGIWTDITERKRDEESLARAATDLRTAQRVAHVGSWRWDAHTGDVQWSDELYRIFGLDPAQPRVTAAFLDPDEKILTEECKARARAEVRQLLADGLVHEADLEFTRANGSVGWVVAHAEPVRDDAGRIVGITGTAADITALKDLERLRDEWTSVIAHDLRQPIGTILMASELLPTVRKDALNQDERSLADRIHSASQSLRRMVDDLLDMSLLESNRLKLERRSMNPSDLVRGTLDRLAHLPGIERVHVHAEGTLPPVFVDPVRIEQVLGNLVSNAVKYGDEHSDIIVELAERGGAIEVGVTNHGPGIAPDELGRLFNRFIRSRTTRGSGVPGLGLGLYIAKGIMEAHGGSLRAESIPNETTTFRAALPMSTEQRAAA